MTGPAFQEVLQRLAGAGVGAQVVEAVALVRYRQRQDSVGGQEAFALAQETDQVGHVLDHVRGDDPVETAGCADQFAQRLAAPDVVDLLDGSGVVAVAALLRHQAGSVPVASGLHPEAEPALGDGIVAGCDLQSQAGTVDVPKDGGMTVQPRSPGPRLCLARRLQRLR